MILPYNHGRSIANLGRAKTIATTPLRPPQLQMFTVSSPALQATTPSTLTQRMTTRFIQITPILMTQTVTILTLLEAFEQASRHAVKLSWRKKMTTITLTSIRTPTCPLQTKSEVDLLKLVVYKYLLNPIITLSQSVVLYSIFFRQTKQELFLHQSLASSRVPWIPRSTVIQLSCFLHGKPPNLWAHFADNAKTWRRGCRGWLRANLTQQ